MKTEQQDSFWKWYGAFVAAGLAGCLVFGFILIELRPAVDLTVIAAEAPTSTPTTTVATNQWWPFDPEYSPYNPW